MNNSLRPLALFFVVVALITTGAFAQSESLAPGDNLVVEGIPAIPASIADDVARYTEFRSASIASWHPTRREMLISTRFGDTNQVHLVKMPGGARTQLTFSRERAGSPSYRPKTGEFFVFNKDIGGNEFYQYYRYNLADGTITLLTDGKSRNTGWNWSNAGDRAVYTSTRRNGRDTDLYIINPSDPKRGRADGEDGAGKQRTRVVLDGERRRPRIQQEEEPGFSVLRDRDVYKGVSAEVRSR